MDFSLSDCNFCAHSRKHVDTQVAVDVSFSFACLPGNVCETKRRKRKPVKHQFSKHMFLFCGFWNSFNVMQKPFREEQKLLSE